MSTLQRTVGILAISCCVALAALEKANAHMMPAQRGTLNVVDKAVFMVLSLPASAFLETGIDTNDDGELTLQEFSSARDRIMARARQGISLDTSAGEAPLVGMMISPDADHARPSEPLRQIVVLGRFNVQDTGNAMYFRVTLFGVSADERFLTISARRSGEQPATEFVLSPQMPIGLVNFARYTM